MYCVNFKLIYFALLFLGYVGHSGTAKVPEFKEKKPLEHYKKKCLVIFNSYNPQIVFVDTTDIKNSLTSLMDKVFGVYEEEGLENLLNELPLSYRLEDGGKHEEFRRWFDEHKKIILSRKRHFAKGLQIPYDVVKSGTEFAVEHYF